MNRESLNPPTPESSEESMPQAPSQVSEVGVVEPVIDRVEREAVRQRDLVRVREELGMQGPKPKEYVEDREYIGSTIKLFVSSVEELFQSVSRYGLPKVNFDSRFIEAANKPDGLDKRALLIALEDLNNKIRKISLHEDRGKIIIIEPFKIRQVIDNLDKVDFFVKKIRDIWTDDSEFVRSVGKTLTATSKAVGLLEEGIVTMSRFQRS